MTSAKNLRKFNCSYARLINDTLVYGKVPMEYTTLPGSSWSHVISTIEYLINVKKDKKLKNFEVTELLIRDFISLCKKNNIKLLIFGVNNADDTKKMIDNIMSKEKEPYYLLTSINFKSCGYTFAPYDPHPNQKGQQFYAKTLIDFLGTHLPDTLYN